VGGSEKAYKNACPEGLKEEVIRKGKEGRGGNTTILKLGFPIEKWVVQKKLST